MDKKVLIFLVVILVIAVGVIGFLIMNHNNTVGEILANNSFSVENVQNTNTIKDNNISAITSIPPSPAITSNIDTSKIGRQVTKGEYYVEDIMPVSSDGKVVSLDMTQELITGILGKSDYIGDKGYLFYGNIAFNYVKPFSNKMSKEMYSIAIADEFENESIRKIFSDIGVGSTLHDLLQIIDENDFEIIDSPTTNEEGKIVMGSAYVVSFNLLKNKIVPVITRGDSEVKSDITVSFVMDENIEKINKILIIKNK